MATSCQVAVETVAIVFASCAVGRLGPHFRADRAFPFADGLQSPSQGPSQSLLVEPATTGNSTALRPSGPCSIVTVAFL